MRQSIFVIGECMIELQREGTGLAYRFGGDSLNAAVYLSRQIDHARFEVAYVSALGVDTLSDEMCAGWEEERISTRWVQRLPDKLTGIYLIETDTGGERHFHYWRGDSAARFWMRSPQAPRAREALADAPFVYLSGISLAILPPADRELLLETLSACRMRGGKVIFDNNYRPRLWESAEVAADIYRRVLKLTDIALLTLDDEEALFAASDEAAVIARTRAFGVSEVVIKRGAKSCIVATSEGRIEVAAEIVSTAIDTTAAGDSFGAAYLAARLSRHTPAEAAQAGHRLAAIVIQHRGAIIPREMMPNW